jgi:hypothetical protein
MLKPLINLEDWMIKKEKEGKGISARDGNGSYFWDFENMQCYSPFDDELLYPYDRSFELEDQDKIVQKAYQKYNQEIAYMGSPFPHKFYNDKKECTCLSLDLFRYGCRCSKN